MLQWLSIIVATLCVQIPNIWAIKKFATEPSFVNALYISLLTLPMTFLATACYAYFYGTGSNHLSYPSLAVSAYGISLTTAFIVQHLILKNKPILWIDMLAIAFILIGLFIYIYRDYLVNKLI